MQHRANAYIHMLMQKAGKENARRSHLYEFYPHLPHLSTVTLSFATMFATPSSFSEAPLVSWELLLTTLDGISHEEAHTQGTHSTDSNHVYDRAASLPVGARKGNLGKLREFLARFTCNAKPERK